MSSISIELNADQLEHALRQLGPAEQLRIAKRLAAWQMDQVVKKLRRTVRRKGLTPTAIDHIVEHARQEVAHRHSHRLTTRLH
ncbi:MAG: hypothetical protein HYZ89_02410 [Candidatus Omnitrophica bacterium]|nr:hypothetical protein [Candidatus Omnitrophota bacterium]